MCSFACEEGVFLEREVPTILGAELMDAGVIGRLGATARTAVLDHAVCWGAKSPEMIVMIAATTDSALPVPPDHASASAYLGAILLLYS